MAEKDDIASGLSANLRQAKADTQTANLRVGGYGFQGNFTASFNSGAQKAVHRVVRQMIAWINYTIIQYLS